MPLNTAIPVRFDQKTETRLLDISQRTGVPVAQMIRFAVLEYLETVEKKGRIDIEIKDTPVMKRRGH